MDSTTRPTQLLHALTRDYPDLSRVVDQFWQGKGTALPDWPEWCFLPMAAWYAIASYRLQQQRLDINQAREVSRLAAIGSWRYTQGVYVIDPTLAAALLDTPITGNLPASVLYRLPEWCVYLPTPGRTWGDHPLYGFFAHLEQDTHTGRTELRIVLDSEPGLIGMPIHLGDWSVRDAVDRAFTEATHQAAAVSVAFAPPATTIARIAEQMTPLISLLLYLCADQPEVDPGRQPGISADRPSPTKTKQGWRWFPPVRARVWPIGAVIGQAVRDAQAAGGTGGTVRPHVRRAHWHGYWTGPRDGTRTFVYRWLPPMLVASVPMEDE